MADWQSTWALHPACLGSHSDSPVVVMGTSGKLQASPISRRDCHRQARLGDRSPRHLREGISGSTDGPGRWGACDWCLNASPPSDSSCGQLCTLAWPNA